MDYGERIPHDYQASAYFSYDYNTTNELWIDQESSIEGFTEICCLGGENPQMKPLDLAPSDACL